MTTPQAANDTYKLPPRLFNARCKACWLLLGVVALVVASFATLNLQWAQFASMDAIARMGRFLAELLHPQTGTVFLGKVGVRRPGCCSTRCAAHPNWCGPPCF